MAKKLQRRGNKYWTAIQSFVTALGWEMPRRFEHLTPKTEPGTGRKRLVFYESGDVGTPHTDCFIQLNELGIEDKHVLLSGAVYAIRYRICTGWHPIRLLADADEAMHVAATLSPWLGRKNFVRYASRRVFRELHPETVGYSWSKVRQLGPPYFVVVIRQNGRLVVKQEKSVTCKLL
jgi:hypothetical protein